MDRRTLLRRQAELKAENERNRIIWARKVKLAGIRKVRHADLLHSVAATAFSERVVPKEVFLELRDLRLLAPSTLFRRSLCPDEEWILWGECEDRAGYLGFNESGELVSIDERRPKDRRLRRQESKWVEIS